jgi:hypothetical protein
MVHNSPPTGKYVALVYFIRDDGYVLLKNLYRILLGFSYDTDDPLSIRQNFCEKIKDEIDLTVEVNDMKQIGIVGISSNDFERKTMYVYIVKNFKINSEQTSRQSLLSGWYDPNDEKTQANFGPVEKAILLEILKGKSVYAEFESGQSEPTKLDLP